MPPTITRTIDAADAAFVSAMSALETGIVARPLVLTRRRHPPLRTRDHAPRRLPATHG